MSLFKPNRSESRSLARMVLVIALLVVISAGTYVYVTPENKRCQNTVEAVRKLNLANAKVKELAQKDWDYYQVNKNKSEGMTRIYGGFNDYFNSSSEYGDSYRNNLKLKYLVVTGDQECFSPLFVARAKTYLKTNN